MRAPWIFLLCASCAGEALAPTAVPCASAEDCGDGWACSAVGVCVATGTCLDDLDCSGRQVCVEAACVAAPPCVDDEACDAGLVCSGTGVCIDAGTCRLDGDCGADQVCSTTDVCIPQGTCAAHADCDAAHVCAAGVCTPGSECGAYTLTIESVVPDLLVVLDRSCSMQDPITPGGPRKWPTAVAAVTALVDAYAERLRWGLALYPDVDADRCGQAAPTVALADGAGPEIVAQLTAALAAADPLYPDGPCVTNTDAAVTAAAADPALADPARPHHVLLVTDGKQAGCEAFGGDAGTVAQIAALAAEGVATHVVGFGGAVDGPQLAAFAAAGGAAPAGTPGYHQADDAAQLTVALGQIAAQLVSCALPIPDAPADLDPARLHAFFDETLEMPRDPSHVDGWDWDAATSTVTFYGPACDQLRSGSVADVDLVYACPALELE